MNDARFENNPVLKHAFDFALMIISYCELLREQKQFIISNQLLRSGTSIGANIMEAQNPESRADFLHKMKIAAKEAEETQYWLLLCQSCPTFPDCSVLLIKIKEINKLLGSIISSIKGKMQNKV